MVVPVWAIPLIVQIGSKLIDLAFKKIDQLPIEKQVKVAKKLGCLEANGTTLHPSQFESSSHPSSRPNQYDNTTW